jgi:hypothetical protein
MAAVMGAAVATTTLLARRVLHRRGLRVSIPGPAWFRHGPCRSGLLGPASSALAQAPLRTRHTTPSSPPQIQASTPTLHHHCRTSRTSKLFSPRAPWRTFHCPVYSPPSGSSTLALPLTCRPALVFFDLLSLFSILLPSPSAMAPRCLSPIVRP